MASCGAQAGSRPQYSCFVLDGSGERNMIRSVLPHREGRSRSSRLRGGMRWTPEMRRRAVHEGRLPAGRTALLWSGYHWDRRAGLPKDGKISCTTRRTTVFKGERSKSRDPGTSPCAMRPAGLSSGERAVSGVVMKLQVRSPGVVAKRAVTTHRVRNAGLLPVAPKVLTHSLADDRIGVRPRGASGTRRSACPLARGRECKGRRRPRAANNRGDDACPVTGPLREVRCRRGAAVVRTHRSCHTPVSPTPAGFS